MDLKEPITTQEALDELIKSRLERERDKVRGEFPDYEELKTKASKLDELEKNGSEELKAALAEVDKLKGDIANRDKEAEIAKVRKQVARATGVPEDLIQGTDEKSMKAFADQVAAFAKKPSAPSLSESGRSTEGGVDSATKFGEFFTENFGN